MKPANYAPVYACIYPQLAELTRRHGYALSAHGTMGRDFDLIAELPESKGCEEFGTAAGQQAPTPQDQPNEGTNP